MPYRNIPIITKTVTIRSPRGILLLVVLFPVVFSIFILSIVFTIWPDILEHSPISFEPRGFWHHVWHYVGLMGGSLLALWGMLSPKPHRIPTEAAGLIVLTAALGMNTAALVDDLLNESAPYPAASGLDLALRFGVIVMFIIRTYILLAQPEIRMPTTIAPESGD